MNRVHNIVVCGAFAGGRTTVYELRVRLSVCLREFMKAAHYYSPIANDHSYSCDHVEYIRTFYDSSIAAFVLISLVN